MNMQRLLILGLAALAAGAAALLVRGFLGGGTPKVAAALPPPIATVDVLVASADIQPGQHLDPTQVKWQAWPRSSLDPNLITRSTIASVDAAVNGTVVRAPIVAGEPITNTKIVRTDAAGIMAATVTPGMRAVSISVTTDTGAGGFILPNDRVDLLASVQVSENPKRYEAGILYSNLRVLAMDQTYKQDKDQKVVLAKTATLEVTPEQAEGIAKVQAVGSMSLALRSLADSTASALAQSALADSGGKKAGPVSVVRYGLPRAAGQAKGE